MHKIKYILQNLIFIPCVVVSTIIGGLLVIIITVFSKKSPLIKKIEYMWSKVVIWSGGIDIVCESTQLDKNKCYIFISNHLSLLDIPIIMKTLKDFSPRFIAKDSLFKIPVFGWGMKAVGHIPIHRKNKRKALRDLNKAVETLKKGESVVIFPEGTRNIKENRLLDFQVGPFILAIKLGLEMVPITIYGTNKCLPRGNIFVRPSKVYIRVHKPLDWPKKYSIKQREELKNNTQIYMQEKYLELIKWVKEKKSLYIQ